MNNSIGPLMIDVDGHGLSAEDIEILDNPMVGGLILFTRNYRSQLQISDLCQSVREAAADRPILIAVDHEGGRVQRFGESFTSIPPMREFGKAYDIDPRLGVELAKDTGQLIARELRAVGIDFSFTPVLDIDHGVSQVIGDRAFHHDPDVIATLAVALINGLGNWGMASVGKHFPGHGGVSLDSHVDIPIDDRDIETILELDVAPFAKIVGAGVTGIMPAHVIFPAGDSAPAGFSEYWLQTVLRRKLGFTSAIFSDDLSMQAAHVGGDIVERAHAAAQAGCDMLLVCNDRAAVKQLLDNYDDEFVSDERDHRLQAMRGKDVDTDIDKGRWQTIRDRISQMSKH